MRAHDDRFHDGTRLLCAALMMFPASVLAGSTDLARVAPGNTTLYIGWSGRDHAIEAANGTAAGKTLADPQVQLRNMVVEIDHPVAGRYKTAGNPIKTGGEESFHPPPTLGQHTEEVLGGLLGYPSSDIQSLRKARAI